MNNLQDKVEFCPKCGGIMIDGICNSCSYRVSQHIVRDEYTDKKQMQAEWEAQLFEKDIQQSFTQQKNSSKSHRKSKGVTFGIVLGVIAFMGISAVCIFAFTMNFMKNVHIAFNQSGVENAIETTPDSDGLETMPYVEQIPIPDSDTQNPAEGKEPDEDSEQPDMEDMWSSFLTKQDEADNPFLADDYISHLGTNHQNHLRNEFQGAQYENICDSIDYEVPYQIERKYYSYISEENNTQMHFSCVTLQGNLPNIEAINQAIYDKTLFLARVYLENYASYVSEKGINISVDSYITYNDNTKISIVLDEYYKLEQNVNIDLYCINIDLDTGMLLNNGNILNMDETFAKEFRERSTKQNGDNDALDQMDDFAVLDRLQNEYENIIFYTPLGMELGINYEQNGSTGWITVTYEDYLQYMYRL